MGSTSEAYENGTNVVVYVANEHGRLQSQQHQLQHQAAAPQLQLQPAPPLQLPPPAQLQFQPQQQQLQQHQQHLQQQQHIQQQQQQHFQHQQQQLQQQLQQQQQQQQLQHQQLQQQLQHQQQQQLQHQQQYHRYQTSPQIVSTSAHSSDDSAPPSPAVYKAAYAAAAPPPSSVSVGPAPVLVNYEVAGAAKGQFYEAAGNDGAAGHHLTGGCAPHAGGAHFAGVDGGIACDNGPSSQAAFAYHAGGQSVAAGALYDKLAEPNPSSAAPHFVGSAGGAPGVGAVPPAEAPFAPPPRSESARSVDSVNSASSGLSCSSSSTPTPTTGASNGGKHLSAEAFGGNPSGGGVADGGAADAFAGAAAKQSVAFSSASPPAPYRIVPVPFSIANKDMGGNTAAAAAAAATAAAFQKPAVSVPLGWKRILNNGSVIYISPDSTVLNSLEQVNSYLLTDGNCFCGLDCPLYSHTVFNFDPEVVTSPVPASSGELSKLCNHKRKRSASSIGQSPVLQNQPYENMAPQSSIASRPLIINNCNPAVVKKYGFDISDRRKKRKLMPGQMYITEDTAVPSTNVMVPNDCDISAKETSTSVINPHSQVENNAYSHQPNGMAMGMPEQSLAAPGVPAMRLKAPTFNQGYQNQAFFNGRPQNEAFGTADDCYYRPVHDQNNVYVSQEVFHSNQNPAGYVCNQLKSGPQQPCNAAPRSQHHHCMSQQHRVPCGPDSVPPPHHHAKPQQPHLAQQPGQQFVGQHAANFQQMRVIPNHHGVHSAMDGQMQVDDKFQQGQPYEKYHAMPESDHSCGLGSYRVGKNETFCNCYHNDSGHMHHQHSSCLQDCSNCSSVPNGSVHHDMQSHHPQHHNIYPNQMQSHQLYHHQGLEQSQQQMQQQQLLIVDPQQQSQAQQLLPNQVHVMQPTNGEMKPTQVRCSSMHEEVQQFHPTQQRTNWHQKNSPATTPCQGTPPPMPVPPPPNPYERVPPLHPHLPPGWNEERKKVVKGSKSPTNVAVRKQKFTNQTHNTHLKRIDVANAPVPSFMDDPSGYLAQQTALLNSTILKQTGENPHSNDHSCFPQAAKPAGSCISSQNLPRSARTSYDESKSQSEAKTPDSSIQNDTALPTTRKNSSGSSTTYKNQVKSIEENPVTSSTCTDRERNASVSPSGSKSPIQAGTVSTSNQSPIQPGTRSPSVCGTPITSSDGLPQSPFSSRNTAENDCTFVEPITTLANNSSSNSTITPVVAGKSNVAVVSSNSGVSHTNGVSVSSGSSSSSSTSDTRNTITVSSVADENRVSASSAILTSSPVSQYEPLTKSPLEMVQNVVSSIQIPSQTICSSGNETKPTPVPQNSGLHTSHFLVSNSGQVLMATSSNPPHSAAAVVSQHQNHHHLATSSAKMNSPLTMISNSSVVTNATGTVTQMIPTVGVPQQMLSQPTVLVNTLPSGQLVFQPSMMALDSAGNAVQIPQLTVATNNLLPSPTLAEASGTISVTGNGSFSPRGSHQANLLSPESAKRKANTKKRKVSPQHMLISSPGSQSAAGTTSVVVQQSQPQQSFAQSAPMLQTLILPNKGGQFAGGQPLIATANVLQPLNLVHNIPTIQQFIVPAGVSGMVMNGDGTATILPETVQLNVLTPMQNATNAMYAGGQGILTASPATGMVIRTQPGTSPTTQLRSQAISAPSGTQFIATQSPNQFIVNSSPAFNNQLSPIVANVSPTQQIHAFNTSPTSNLTSRTATPQEYLQCVNAGSGQTLMVPCSVGQQSSNPQNTTVVQQNTTIVQQQMTMVSNNQQLPDNATSSSQSGTAAGSSINLGQHNIILNDGKQPQNFIITTEKASPQSQGGFVLSPNKNDKLAGSQQHFILNNLNTEKQSQSFIISSPSDKPLCGNFILANTSEKTNSRSSNLIIASAAGQQAAIPCSQASLGVNAATSSTMNASRFAKQSVSTQTANAAAAAANAAGQQVLQISSTPTLIVATNNTFSQTSNSYTSSPPDTTTHSPVGTSGQSPDTPSSSSIVVGSTDDVAASPTSSTPASGQAMVHCISSSNVVDWSDNNFEEKKLNIIVDHSSSDLISGGIDMFQSMGSMQQHFRRRPSDESKGVSYIESSTFDESAIRK